MINKTAAIAFPILLFFLLAMALPAQAQSDSKSITPEQLRANQKRASLYLRLGYTFNPSTTSATQMDQTVQRGQRAKYWKQRGFTFDPTKTTPEEMDRHAYATQRAKYWKDYGYDFDPKKMNTAQMDLHALEADPVAYWKRLGIQYDAALLDKTKTQLLIQTRITAPSPAVRKQQQNDLATRLKADRLDRQILREDLQRLTPTSQTKTPAQRLNNRLAEEKSKSTSQSKSVSPSQAVRNRQAERTRIFTPATRVQDAKNSAQLPGQRVTVHTPNRNTFNERRDTRESTNKQTVRTSLTPINARRDLRNNPTPPSRSSGSSSSLPINTRRASRDNSTTP